MGEQALFAVDVWVWRNRYGGLHAGWEPRTNAVLRQVPLPTNPAWLRRYYRHLTKMIAEREKAGHLVTRNLPAITVRVWERGEELHASLTRRTGAMAITFSLPAELVEVRRWHALIVGQMQKHGIPLKAPAKRLSQPKVVSVATTDRYPESGSSRFREVPAGLPSLGRRR